MTPNLDAASSSPLSHLDANGQVRMVDVSERPATVRQALAEGFIAMAPATLELVRDGRAAKGDVLAVARVAAIQAAKRTWELIPLCHPLPLSGVEVRLEASADGSGLRLEACARTTAATGVEMEALTAVQVGLLTLYDMLKSVDPAMVIGPVRLLSKTGGRHGAWRHPDGLATAVGTTDQAPGHPEPLPAPWPEPSSGRHPSAPSSAGSAAGASVSASPDPAAPLPDGAPEPAGPATVETGLAAVETDRG